MDDTNIPEENQDSNNKNLPDDVSVKANEEVDIPLRWTGCAQTDYRSCLERIKVKYRNHSYRGNQFSTDRGKTWKPVSDGQEAIVNGVIEKSCRFVDRNGKNKVPNFSKAVRYEAVQALLASNEYNPLRNWLGELTSSSEPINLITFLFDLDFDETITSKYTDAELDRYSLDWSLHLGKGVWYRTFYPDCNYPYFPLLIGPQGCGKSYLVYLVFPSELASEITTRGLDMRASMADRLAICQRGAIVECSELAGHGKKDVADLKAFISDTGTTVRMPFHRNPGPVFRHFVVLGTTNEPNFLSLDPSGDRRHIPIPVKPRDITNKITIAKRLEQTMDEIRLPYWQWVKWAVTVDKQDTSYVHWHPTSLKIREDLMAISTKRPYLLEKHIMDLLTDKASPYYDTEKCLTDHERVHGIPLSAPPDYQGRTIMTLLPPSVTGIRTPSYVGCVLSRMGWTRERQRVGNLRLTFRIPPRSR